MPHVQGSVVALDASTGNLLLMNLLDCRGAEALSKCTGRRPNFWARRSSDLVGATIDAKRGVLYVGTGNSYGDAPNTGANAIIAMDLATGQMRWSRQVTAGDNYLLGCTGASVQPRRPSTHRWARP